MDYASVSIYNTADARLVDGMLSNEKGVFNFDGLAAGDYYLKVDFIGYNARTIHGISIENNKTIDLDDIRLGLATKLLNEVVGERSFDRTNYSAHSTVMYKVDKSNMLTAGLYPERRTQFRLADITYNNTKN